MPLVHKKAYINPVTDLYRWSWGRWRSSEELGTSLPSDHKFITPNTGVNGV